ncbi:MAG: hypothetical protein RJB01_1398, partial [Actinomycetota bacterium]
DFGDSYSDADGRMHLAAVPLNLDVTGSGSELRSEHHDRSR